MNIHDIELPPLPEWSKMDNLGGLVPSEIRQVLAVYAHAAIEADRKLAGDLEAQLEKALTERDDYHDMADQLAEQIAAITDQEIGEHSSGNNPWQNAMLAADEWIAKDIRRLTDGVDRKRRYEEAEVDTPTPEDMLNYAMYIAHERELHVGGHKHDEPNAIERFNAAVQRLIDGHSQRRGESVAWQFYDNGRWWNGDDRIKDHRKNTESAGYKTRDLYTALQPAEPSGASNLHKDSCGAQNENQAPQPTEPVRSSGADGIDYDKPQIGSTWRHYNGNLYTVEGFTNENTERPEKYPVTILYRGENGHVWSRPLSRWIDSMSFVKVNPVTTRPSMTDEQILELAQEKDLLAPYKKEYPSKWQEGICLKDIVLDFARALLESGVSEAPHKESFEEWSFNTGNSLLDELLYNTYRLNGDTINHDSALLWMDSLEKYQESVGLTAIPEGWKLVPVDLTQDMEIVGHRAFADATDLKLVRAWDAMLKAVPTYKKEDHE